MVLSARRSRRASLHVVAFATILLAGLAPSAVYAASTFVVTTSADVLPADPDACATGVGACSLRGAIEAANAVGSQVTIEFDLDDGLTIQPTIPLPPITGDDIFINARQPASDPIVEIDGSLTPTQVGLVLEGTEITVAGLIINRFIGGTAISVSGTNATLLGNYLGPDRTGSASYGNPGNATAQGHGIMVHAGGSGLTVGGATAADRNVISGNAVGIDVTASGAAIRGNYIGMSRTGLAPVPNARGVAVDNAGVAVIGPENTISGNTVTGVELTAASGSTVIGNFIGLGADGTTAAGNGTRGIRAVSNNNVIGGPNASDRNVIASNNQGIHIRQDGNTVRGNWIGIDATGTVARPNSTGIQIEPVVGGSDNNTIMNNVISGNLQGVAINGTITNGTGLNNKFYGNLIGTNPTGVSAIPNFVGILTTAQGTLIGGMPPLQGNVISGNTDVGVRVAGVLGRASLNNNKIGVNINGAPLGNGSHGVQFSSSNSSAGGTPAFFNRIAHNGGAGIFVDGTTGHVITGNSIEANVGLGIDLAPLGVNSNDALDADGGPNGSQNFAVITAAVSNGVDTRISGEFHGTPNVGTTVHAYRSPSCDPSGNGEGATLLGDFYVETDGNGDASFTDKIVAASPVGAAVTATSTAMGSDDTSEFSSCVPVTAPPPPPTCTPNAIMPADGPADLTWDGAGPSTAASYQSNMCIYRFDELQDFELPLDVRPAAPRSNNMAVTNPPTRLLQEGRVVSSHLLHADTIGAGVQDGVLLHGTVTFADPILGVIMGRNLMVETDAAVSPGDLDYEASYSLRGIEFNTSDVVRVSPTDPRTLEVTFAVNAMDEIRVFTGEETEPVCDALPGNAVVFATGPADLTRDGAVQSDDCIFVFEEQQDIVLTENLLPAAPKTTNMARTGPQTRLLPAGTRLSSHLLHMDVEGTTGRVLSGSWTFDEPILGVFMGRNRMVETDGLVGLPTLSYDQTYLPRGLEFDTADVVRVAAGDPYTLEVTFSTNTMDEIRVFTGNPTSETFSGSVAAGGTVTTDSEGDGAVLADGDTIETTITSPNDGPVSIEESIGTPGVGSLSIYGFTVQISAPTASVANPLVLRFRLDASVFDPAWALSTLVVNRDGARALNCTAAGATPNPCVESRFRHADGDAGIVIRTSQASEWEIGRAAPEVDAGGPYTVAEGSALTLAGSAIGDDPFSYLWLGDTSGLSDVTSATPSVATSDDAQLALELEATDAQGYSGRSATTVTVTNAAPVAGTITGPPAPIAIGGSAAIEMPFSDAGSGDTHTVIIDWGDATTSPASVDQALDRASGSHLYAAPGVYAIAATVTDDDGASSTAIYQFAVIYDPKGGFVTGSGWINSPPGAYRPDPTATGRANFGFVSKYAKGSSVPSGQTSFQFNTAGFDFRSDTQHWLVVNQGGSNAQFKGVGSVNGSGTYSFMVWAGDGAPDTFRIKVWQDSGSGEVIVYDTDTGVVLGGGSIIVHKGK